MGPPPRAGHYWNRQHLHLHPHCGFMGTVFVCVWVLSADASDQFCFYLHSTINGKLNSCIDQSLFTDPCGSSAVFCADDEPSEAPCWAESNSIKCGSLIKKWFGISNCLYPSSSAPYHYNCWLYTSDSSQIPWNKVKIYPMPNGYKWIRSKYKFPGCELL